MSGVTRDLARTCIERGVKRAQELGFKVAIAVVDEAGHLVVCERMDGALWVTPEIARATLDRNEPVTPGGADFTRTHIWMLLGQARLDVADLDGLAIQLTAALEGPILLALWMPEPPVTARSAGSLADSWQLHRCGTTTSCRAANNPDWCAPWGVGPWWRW